MCATFVKNALHGTELCQKINKISWRKAREGKYPLRKIKKHVEQMIIKLEQTRKHRKNNELEQHR